MLSPWLHIAALRIVECNSLILPRQRCFRITFLAPAEIFLLFRLVSFSAIPVSIRSVKNDISPSRSLKGGKFRTPTAMRKNRSSRNFPCAIESIKLRCVAVMILTSTLCSCVPPTGVNVPSCRTLNSRT